MFVDVNRRVSVILYEIFVKDDRIFIVVTIEGHETNEKVLTQCELTILGR